MDCATCHHPQSVHRWQRTPSRYHPDGYLTFCGIREANPTPCPCTEYEPEPDEETA